MKKRILLGLVLLFSILSLTACNNNAIKFKEDYESLNGKTNKYGMENRTVEISKKNPYIYSTAADIVKKIENKETFYVYFGSTLCPWCRSVIEKSIESANNNEISKIYYVDIWDSEGNEILRDKLSVNDNGTLDTIFEGTSEYRKLLAYFDNVLADYSLTDKNKKNVPTNEKRIYAPNFIYIENGEAKKLITGISDKQSGPLDELTDEILKDEEEAFNSFFKSNNSCSIEGKC